MEYENHRNGFIVSELGYHRAIFVPTGGGPQDSGLFEDIEEARKRLEEEGPQR